MKKRGLKKSFLLLAILGLVSFNMNAQLYQFASDTEGWSNGFQMASTTFDDDDATNGWTNDGGLILTRTSNNATINAPAPLNGTVNNYMKIRVKNESGATSIRFAVQEDKPGGGFTTIWLTQSIDANSAVFKTYYIKLDGPETIGSGEWAQSGQAANQPDSPSFWGEATETVFLLFRGGYVDDASTPGVEEGGKQIFVESIEFLNIQSASTYAEFVGAESADISTPGTIEPTLNGNANTTGVFFPGGGSRIGSFSDTQVFEGDYSFKMETSNAGTADVSGIFIGSGAGNPAGSKFTTTAAGKHLMVLNVYIESGNPARIQTNFDASSTSRFQTINWDTEDLEKGKWHRLTQEITFRNLDNTADAVVSDGVKTTIKVAADNGNSVVVYVDGLEAIADADYISTTGTSAGWSLGTTWDSGLEPTATDIVYIKNNVNIFFDSEVAKEIFVNDGNVLTLTAGANRSLTVDELHTNKTGSVVAETGTSLIVNNLATGGKVTYKRELSYTAGNLEGWHLIAAPVVGQAYGTGTTWIADNDIASGTGTNKGIATYNNAVAASNWSYSDGSASSFTNGKGYSMKRGTNTGDVSFTGSVNTKGVTSAITVGAGTPFNLVGNPYTSYINSATFLTTNTALLTSQTIWIWNPSTKNYDAKVTGDDFKVAPGQGFFVSATAGGNVSFAKAIQSHESPDTFLRSEAKPEIILNVTNGKLNRFARVYYANNATKSFDNGLDGATFTGLPNELDVFTNLLDGNSGEAFQVQGLPNADLEKMVVPVGVKVEGTQEITFTAEALNIPSGLNIYLEDRQENVFTQLNEVNAEYKVSVSEASNGIGRFYLHTRSSALSTEDDVILNSVSIFKSDRSTLKIAGLKNGKAAVSLFNIHGKNVMNASFDTNGVKEIALPKLATGVYIVQLTTESGKLSKKIILE
ncbi:T9SS type A sorting domain-containing protein [Polaribacter staleyi]|uniref:T9SS type A sorting domain-containing protein n=1 Tax=Polaribacter staleyi TaxID=2022337 RepID=UPI0031BB4BEA